MHDEPPFFLLTQLEYITVDEQTFEDYTNITELNSRIKKCACTRAMKPEYFAKPENCINEYRQKRGYCDNEREDEE